MYRCIFSSHSLSPSLVLLSRPYLQQINENGKMYARETAVNTRIPHRRCHRHIFIRINDSLARLLACCCSLFFCTLRFNTQTHTHCRTDSAQKCQRQQIRATDTQNKINSKTNRIKFCVTVLFPFVLQYILPPTLLLLVLVLVLSSFQFSL